MKKAVSIILLFSLFLLIFSCGEETDNGEAYSIAVFVPGVVAGSPIYEMLVTGVEAAVEEAENAEVTVVEGGFNQAEWPGGVTALAATEEYDLIVTSNPAMPEICAGVAEDFPEQRFLCLDGYLESNPAIHTVLFNQREQAFIIGYLGGLVTSSQMEFANEDLKVGLIAGAEYPTMNEIIRPSFELGLRTVDPEIELDFRVVGNWYDASRAGELARSMFDTGIDVILPISGGANQGVLSAAEDIGAYVLWFDSEGYNEAPGIVVGSSVLNMDKAAYERTLSAINGELHFGQAEIVDMEGGYVDFIEDNALYRRYVPEDIREQVNTMLERLRSGELQLNVVM
ncbi:MAG: BMP family ABC transporter substrate-binding protein [Spirochaetia bacterium]